MKSKNMLICASFALILSWYTSSNIIGCGDPYNTTNPYEILGISYFMYTAILTANCYLSEKDISEIFSSQYDYLSKHSQHMKNHGFFPDEPENYKELILSHQLPFFKSFFNGTLTVNELMYFKKAHYNNYISKINNIDFDEMIMLVCKKFEEDYYYLSYLFTPKNLLEKFRSFVVADYGESGGV